MAMLQQQTPDDSDPPVKKPIPQVGSAVPGQPVDPTQPPTVPPAPQAPAQDPSQPNDTGSVGRGTVSDGPDGSVVSNVAQPTKIDPAPDASTPSQFPTPSINPQSVNLQPTDAGGMMATGGDAAPLSMPPVSPLDGGSMAGDAGQPVMPTGVLPGATDLGNGLALAAPGTMNATSTAQPTAGTTPAGVDPGWWNSSGLSSFQNVFQQTFGRQATPQEISQYGGQAANMSWDDVPAMLKAAGVTAGPSGSMGSSDPTDPAPPAPSGTMGSGNPAPTGVSTPASTIPSVGTAFGPGNDLRYTTISPTPSDRTTAAQSATDASAAKVAGFDPNAQTAANVDQFGKDLATPDVAFNGVNTNVSRTAVDPNIAFQGVNTDVSAGPEIDPVTGQRLSTFQQQQQQAAQAVGQGESRQQIAQQTLDAFDQAQAPQIQDAIRSVGQRASALGRIGNGETSVEALKPYTDYLTQRAAMAKQLAADTASGDIQDRLNNLSAASGLVGQTAAEDAATRGEQRTERSNVQDTTAANLARQVAERNAALGVASGNRTAAQQEADAQAGIATGNVSRAMDQNAQATQNAQANAARDAEAKAQALSSGISATSDTGANLRADTGTLAGIEGQATSEDQAAQNANRAERDYQDQISQQAVQAAIQQHLLEQQDQAQQFGQNATIAQIGEQGNPATAYLNASNQAGASSGQDYAALQQLLSQYYAQQPPQQRAA